MLFSKTYKNIRIIKRTNQIKKLAVDNNNAVKQIIKDSTIKIITNLVFKEYDDVIAFVHKVMEIANKLDHHPNMIVHHESVKLSIFDEGKGKVTDKCHKFALAVDKIK